MKNISIKINYQNRIYSVRSVKGKLLKDVLQAEGITYSFPCGGSGRCGKCKIHFTQGAPKAGTADRTFFSAKELEAGYRLLCRCVVDGDCEVNIDDSGEENMVAESVDVTMAADDFSSYGIAVDIGTTTIAAALIGVEKDGSSVVIDSAGGVNHQRQFGADVISRIAYASEEGGLDRLHEIVVSDVEELVKRLATEVAGDINKLVITGNTTMLSIFKNISVESLGKYPYRAERLELETCKMYGIDTVIMPGFSAFVGADILSGVYFLNLTEEGKNLLLDLGTNGEMAYYDGNRLKICSTAAGPVFEGGTISCGVPSIPGAISHVRILEDRNADYKTIGSEEPKGLCGTGVMETVAELVRTGIVSGDGLLEEEFFDKGFPVTKDGGIRLTQEDIRNIQLAKAAVYSGIGQLIGGDVPDKVYISGGFGTNIDYDAIRPLKIFPRGIDGSCEGAGNTALKGALKYLEASLCGREEEERLLLSKIKESATEVILANKEDFDEAFVEALNF